MFPMYLQHGGDRVGFEQQYGHAPLDFSINTNPLGTPPEILHAISDTLAHLEHYPDPLCRSLCGAIAKRLSIAPEYVFCGNGADDLIYRYCYAARPQKALIPVPTFSEYEAALLACGCEIRRWYLSEENDFALTGNILNELKPGTTLFLCEPNNPTGRLTSRPLLQKILRECRRQGCTLAVDESFLDFTEEYDTYSLVSELSGGSLVIFKSFTKMYALAGLRAGCLLSADAGLHEQLQRAGQPWSLSTPAEAAAIAALTAPEMQEYEQKTRHLMQSERAFVSTELQKLGMRVIPSEANFLLFYTPVPDLFHKAAEKDLLLRSCENFAGLSKGWYRTALRTRTENEQMLQIVSECLLSR